MRKVAVSLVVHHDFFRYQHLDCKAARTTKKVRKRYLSLAMCIKGHGGRRP